MSAPTKTHIASIVTDHLEEIRRLAEEHGVERLEVYGDAADGELGPNAPVHFLVTYPEGYDYGPWLERYVALYEAYEALLGRFVHLTMSGAADNSAHRARTIEETRRQIYAAA